MKNESVRTLWVLGLSVLIVAVLAAILMGLRP
jgi:hypothetical protein